MYRQPAVLNPLLEAKERLRKDHILRQRLKKVTKSVDNSCPYSFRPSFSRRPNRKKEQLIRERKNLIEQNNRLLLERISDIMQHNNLDQHAGTRKYTAKMSNIGGRIANLKKINTDNKIMLDRLRNTAAYYDNRIAASDWKVYKKHLQHMGTYAYKGGGRLNGSVEKLTRKVSREMAKSGQSPKKGSPPRTSHSRRRASLNGLERIRKGALSRRSAPAAPALRKQRKVGI